MYLQGLFWLAVVLAHPSLFIPVRFIAYLEAFICFFLLVNFGACGLFLFASSYLGYVNQVVIHHAHVTHRVAMRSRSVPRVCS